MDWQLIGLVHLKILQVKGWTRWPLFVAYHEILQVIMKDWTRWPLFGEMHENLHAVTGLAALGGEGVLLGATVHGLHLSHQTPRHQSQNASNIAHEPSKVHATCTKRHNHQTVCQDLPILVISQSVHAWSPTLFSYIGTIAMGGMNNAHGPLRISRVSLGWHIRSYDTLIFDCD